MTDSIRNVTHLAAGMTMAAGAASAQGAAPPAGDGRDAVAPTVTIVLVHGAFADAMAWARVIPLLERAGYPVVAVENPLTSFDADVATTRRAIDAGATRDRIASPHGQDNPMTRKLGAASTADDVLAGVDLPGTRFLVTGVSSGIGLETARALAARGASVVGAVRDVTQRESAIATVRQAAVQGGGSLEPVALDLASLRSVRAGADELLADGRPFDAVIANAGVMATPPGKTIDGFETQFGTNHVGHLALVNRVAPLLADHGRLAVLSSQAPPTGSRCRSRATSPRPSSWRRGCSTSSASTPSTTARSARRGAAHRVSPRGSRRATRPRPT